MPILFSDSPAQSMNQIMGPACTPGRTDAGAQARALVRIRQAFPGATLRLHAREWGEIVEIRRDGHTIALGRLFDDGTLAPDSPLSGRARVAAAMAA